MSIISLFRLTTFEFFELLDHVNDFDLELL